MLNNEEFQLFVSRDGITIKDPVTRQEVLWDSETEVYFEIVESLRDARMVD